MLWPRLCSHIITHIIYIIITFTIYFCAIKGYLFRVDSFVTTANCYYIDFQLHNITVPLS